MGDRIGMRHRCGMIGYIEQEEGVLRRREWKTFVRTMYKRKDKKVVPVNAPLEGGAAPGGGINGAAPSVEAVDFKPTVIPRGSRLTPERLAAMKIGNGFLFEAERQLFVDILFEFEGAIAFEDSEMGLLNPAIEPPVRIHTVPHVPWQQQNIRLPKSMLEAATAIVKEKLQNGTLEYSQGPYRSRYFLVEKHAKGTYRLINDVQPLNKVTIRESGLPPSVDEFSEDFAGYPISSAIDYYSGYYQVPLDVESRDLTAFMTEVGLLRITRLPQGWTNSVSVFVRVMCKVHCRQIPHQVRPFLDDCGIKGPKDRYGDMEVEITTSAGKVKVRRFVQEHAEIFRTFMRDCWMAGLTISGTKSAIGMRGIEIVGFLCDEEGRRPDPRKVEKILTWPTPRNVKEARGFIGISVYYRMFIVGFSIIAAPIFQLFRKGKRYEWTVDCQLAMDALKQAITSAPVLVTLDFSAAALSIFLNVDASTTIGWGAVLSQQQSDGSIRPARFESGVWSDVERKYDALKLECRGLLKSLKKLRFWLYGRYFTVLTDSQTLVWLLNQPPNDLPNAMMTRWLAYIRLFDFDTKHVPGHKNGAADALSRRGNSEEDGSSEDEVDEFFEARMYETRLERRSQFGDSLERSQFGDEGWCRSGARGGPERVYLDEAEYMGEDLMLGKYLVSLRRPDGLTDSEYQQLRRKSKSFFVRDGYLYKKGKRVPRRVVGLQEQRLKVMEELHDEAGHRGRVATYEHIKRRYQWKGMYSDVEEWVKTCVECQKRSQLRYEEELHPTWSVMVWDKVGMDIVLMPKADDGSEYLVLARDDLSGWVEGRALVAATAENVARFLYEEVICRHGCPRRVVVDGGRENLGDTRDLLRDYRIQRTVISPYHPQTAGLIERGHAPVVNALAKYSKGTSSDWPLHLPLALWADRISVRRSTGYSAFDLVYGRDCVLPVELMIDTWTTVDWEGIKSREDLILARMQQLDQRSAWRILARNNLRNSRKANKTYYDNVKRLRPTSQQLQAGDLVLMLDGNIKKSRNLKFTDRWRGPFRIVEKAENSTFYQLAELDGTLMKSTVAGNRLKKFYSRDVERLLRGGNEYADDLEAELQGDGLEERIEQGDEAGSDGEDGLEG
jgi:RNase H-like domain found in reverse transcriptase/Integrase zinc binding domain/Reverse transcriptase (RNA-dependent DNA polymerase)